MSSESLKIDCIGSWYSPIESIKQFERYHLFETISMPINDTSLWIEGPFVMPIDEFLELSKEYDVAIMHLKQPQPTKKAIKRGEKPVPDKIALVVDVKGGRFTMR